jgi:opacity protein-like surface antigen
MKKTSLLSMLALAVWVLFAQQVTAQRGGQQTAIGGGFQTAIPVGNFANDYDDTPVGLAAMLTAPTWRNSPVHLGFGFAWNTMGSEKQDIYVADGDAFSNASLKVATNKYSYNALARFSPFKGRMQPYIEGIAGMSNYSTKSEISGTYNNGIEYESKDRFQNEVALNYGWGAGLQIRMAPHVFLEGRVERLQSTGTSFINQKELEIDDYGNLDYELIQTKPKWMTIQVGLTFKF